MSAALSLWSRTWQRVVDAVLRPRQAADDQWTQQLADQAPVVWLLGKVQAGKTSIVKAITGHRDAEIGLAFQPCTRFSRVYDFPPEVPVVRFLDTRGLEERDYDPAEDLAVVEGKTHVVVAVVRALDTDLDPLLRVLRGVRSRHPDRSLVLVQTRLHDAYPHGRDHPPYDQFPHDKDLAALHAALEYQREAFRGLPGRGPFCAVAVDLTRKEDGFTDPDYGLDALLDALDEAVAQGRGGILRELGAAARDARLAGIHTEILGYASAAGASDLLPMVGLVTVPVLQGRMLQRIGLFYRMRWDRRRLAEFAASLGSGTVLGIGAKLVARQVAKLIPIYGQLAGAAAAGAASAAVTYALGRAACEYLERVREGRPDAAAVARQYRGSLQHAYRGFRRERQEEPGERPAEGGG